MTTNQLLEHRHKVHLVWVEPWQGATEQGANIDCHAEIRMTVHDCINFYRASNNEAKLAMSDADLLEEFMVVHWASFDTDEINKLNLTVT